jgi:hypothetical protein
MTFVGALSISLATLPRMAVSAENAVNVSWGDHIVVFDGPAKLDTPEKIGAAMDDWKRLTDATTVYWRVSAWYCRNYLEQRRPSFPGYFDEVDRIWGSFDPLACAVEQAHERDLRIYAYQTIYDEGSPTTIKYGDSTPFPWQSRFTIEHPEYLVEDAEGKARQWGVLEYAYPEARQYTIGVLTRLLDEYGFDGLYVCTRTHSKPADRADQFGFNQPVVESYRQRYGTDPRQETDLQRWRDLRGKFLTQLLRELRAERIERDKAVALAIPRGDLIGPPYGNMTLHWRDWLAEGLVDELVVGVTSGNWHYPSLKGKDEERGYLASQDEGWGLPPLEEDLRENYGPLCQKHGVRLVIPGGSWDRAARERAEALPIDGYMFSSASFSGRPGYVIVPNHERLDFADGRLTVECWLKYPEEVTYGRVISKYDHTIGDAGRGWETYIDKEAHVVWRLNDGQTDYSVTSQMTVPAGSWFHLACVSEGAGGQMRIYINGQQDPATRAAPGALRRVPVDLYIGRYGGGGVFLEASIDEVRLSNIAREYAGPPEVPPEVDANTVALWSFDREADKVVNRARPGALAGEVVHVAPTKREDGPPGCGKAIFLGRHD